MDTLTGYQEGMDYGLPCYKKGGVIEVGFASQKKYVALYILKEGVTQHPSGIAEGTERR